MKGLEDIQDRIKDMLGIEEKEPSRVNSEDDLKFDFKEK